VSWLTWRQHRADAVAAGALVAALGIGVILLLVLSPHLYPDGAQRCTGTATFSSCLTLNPQLGSSAWSWISLGGLLFPILVGIVGAKTIGREFEGNGYLLAWTQGVPRRQWFLSRTLVLGCGTMAGAAVLAVVMQGWFAAQRGAGDPIWDGFEVGPIALLGYTLFALALGMAAGALFKRASPAVALTLFSYIAVRVTIAVGARTRYLAPLEASSVMSTSPAGSNVTSSGYPGVPAGGWTTGSPVDVDAAGHTMTAASGCFSAPPVPAGCYPAPITILQPYQPASRFWLFQGIEAAIFVGLALALFALAYRLTMRAR
jgi:hypothetical protein